MEDAFVVIDFPDGGGRQVFVRPTAVVMAERVDEVLPALAEVAARVPAEKVHAAGFVAYEAAAAFFPYLPWHLPDRLPLVWFALFREPGGLTRGRGPFRWTSPWVAEEDAKRHGRAVEAIRAAIGRGDVYQVNHTLRLRASWTGDPWSGYEALRLRQRGAYSAFLDIGPFVVASLSPELFFRVEGRRIVTRPMKGTAPRGRSREEDARLREALWRSEKNRAENLMIVDLLRNDLGRVAQPGSVAVEQLFTIEPYPNVWQMTSEVAAELRPGVGLPDVLRALFPCGSVTGAPKEAALAEIARREASPRGVYCGAIGVVHPDGRMVFNVAIRTLTFDRQLGSAEFGTGGGITWDSTPAEEYREVLQKAAPLQEGEEREVGLIETMRLEGGRFLLQERHVERLRWSAERLGLPVPGAELEMLLERTRTEAEGEPRRVRLLLEADGRLAVTSAPLPTPSEEVPVVALAKAPSRAVDALVYHKTTARAHFEEALAQAGDVFDVLLWNEVGEITEFSRGNVVLERDGVFLTPPLASGLLPGTLRAELLARGLLTEAVLRREDLVTGRLWFINSVRGWVPVRLSRGW